MRIILAIVLCAILAACMAPVKYRIEGEIPPMLGGNCAKLEWGDFTDCGEGKISQNFRFRNVCSDAAIKIMYNSIKDGKNPRFYNSVIGELAPETTGSWIRGNCSSRSNEEHVTWCAQYADGTRLTEISAWTNSEKKILSKLEEVGHNCAFVTYGHGPEGSGNVFDIFGTHYYLTRRNKNPYSEKRIFGAMPEQAQPIIPSVSIDAIAYENYKKDKKTDESITEAYKTFMTLGLSKLVSEDSNDEFTTVDQLWDLPGIGDSDATKRSANALNSKEISEVAKVAQIASALSKGGNWDDNVAQNVVQLARDMGLTDEEITAVLQLAENIAGNSMEAKSKIQPSTVGSNTNLDSSLNSDSIENSSDSSNEPDSMTNLSSSSSSTDSKPQSTTTSSFVNIKGYDCKTLDDRVVNAIEEAERRGSTGTAAVTTINCAAINKKRALIWKSLQCLNDSTLTSAEIVQARAEIANTRQSVNSELQGFRALGGQNCECWSEACAN